MSLPTVHGYWNGAYLIQYMNRDLPIYDNLRSIVSVLKIDCVIVSVLEIECAIAYFCPFGLSGGIPDNNQQNLNKIRKSITLFSTANSSHDSSVCTYTCGLYA